jgi:hypothetical protein
LRNEIKKDRQILSKIPTKTANIIKAKKTNNKQSQKKKTNNKELT